MGDYFQPLWRKAGCVTLILACLFALGLVRSRVTVDQIAVELGPYDGYYVTSSNNRLALSWNCPLEVSYPLRVHLGSLRPIEPNHLIDIGSENFPGLDMDWSWNWHGFQYDAFNDKKDPRIGLLNWIVPYWSLVLPLTLFSGYLLLSKPRPNVSDKKLTH